MSKVSRQTMLDFINSHFYYYTMNSWNGLRSIAANVKIHNLKSLTREEKNALYDLIGVDGFYDDINIIVEDWQYEMQSNGYKITKEQYYEGTGWVYPADDNFEERINKILSLDGLLSESKRKFTEALEQKKAVYCAFKRYKEQCKYSVGFNGRSGGYLVLYSKENNGNAIPDDLDNKEYYTYEDVKYYYDLVKNFDRLVESLEEHCKYMANNCEIEMETVTYSKKVPTLVYKEC